MPAPKNVTRQTNLTYARHPLLTGDRQTLWQGPYDASPDTIEYGITQSMVAKFYCCRERFRLHYCEGLREYETWPMMRAMEWGNLWHEAEHAYLEGRDPEKAITDYGYSLHKKYSPFLPKVARDIEMVSLMFKYYIDYYQRKFTNTNIQPLWAEEEFEVGIDLCPTGIFRQPILRGKMDGVGFREMAARSGSNIARTYLKENKTKERIDLALIKDNLENDNQVMTYLNALECLRTEYDLPPIGGVVYNVIRRPAASQKFETLEAKLKKEPEHYFIRVVRDIDRSEILRFRQQTLIPTLYQMCAWWAWIKADPLNPFRPDAKGVPGGGYHWLQPFNVYNNLSQGRGQFFNLITNGSSTQMHHAETLYPELPQ